MLENKREVYKFWLGFFEKLFLVFVVSIIIPFGVGQLEVPFIVFFSWTLLGLILLVLIAFLSWKFWSLK